MRSVPPVVLSPRQAAERLGFSPQHVRRLVAAGELEAEHLPNSYGREISEYARLCDRYIQRDPEILGGEPVIRGTRVPVRMIEEGESHDVLRED